MSAEEFEIEIRRHIATLEAERDEVVRRIDEAKAELKDKEALLANWNAALTDYQRKNGLIVTIDYSTLQPRERIDLWASKHSGMVVIKDLANVLVDAGAAKNYKSAYASIRWSVSRRNDFQQVEPGVYRRVEDG